MRARWLVCAPILLLAAPGHADMVPYVLAPTTPVDIGALPCAPSSKRVAEAAHLIDNKDFARAQKILADQDSPAAALLTARAQRELGALDAAAGSLKKAAAAPLLASLVSLEQGKLAWARQDGATAAAQLLPIVLGDDKALSMAAVTTLVQALREQDPNSLVQNYARFAAVLPRDDLDARSRLLEARAQALESLGRADEARAARLARYLEEPVSLATPDAPPPGTTPTSEQLLARLERLLEAHRNDRVLAGLDALADSALTPELQCRKRFAEGLAARKVRQYPRAETALSWAETHCQDEELRRRASYLNAKVISIRDGLRAIDSIEAFAKRYAGSTMVDDVLFWAGDMYQRRGRDVEASQYYSRIEALPHDDQCSEARWRLAWMAYRRGELDQALTILNRLVLPDGCVRDKFDAARAHFWQARIREQQGDVQGAITAYRATMAEEALSFYAQAALPRILRLQSKTPKDMTVTIREALAPQPAADPLCPDFLTQDAAFRRGMDFLLMGLESDAAAQFRTVALPSRTSVVDTAHAEAQGVPGAPVVRAAPVGLEACGRSQGTLLLILLLDRSGAQNEAHWRLRTDFAAELAHFPSPHEVILWRAAYPLAFRDFIAAAEKESGVPPYFLQALTREESAFDPHAISWAQAGGLTQLVLPTAQSIGKRLVPPVPVPNLEALLDPALSARLGGALIGSMIRHYNGNLGLALAAYNAGDEVAVNWWKRYAGEDFTVFAEEMTIQETRGYVKRVLRTYGVYRWLYATALPTLPVENTLPNR